MEKEHLANLAQELNLKREKCAIMLSSVAFLGHVFRGEGLCTEDSKVEAIADAPDPKNLSELCPFLGTVNCYGKFLLNNVITTLPSLTIVGQRRGKLFIV